jgi:NAD(P)-dependent dehydrogenase (short-subunit alcohol dehydrogenase family)
VTRQLQGKVAVVTGGGSGLGEAIARRFAAEGAEVIVAGRREELLQRVARDISGLAVPTDVSSEGEVAALMATCRERFGKLNILVNNAGWGGAGLVKVEDMDVEKWDRMFAVNVRGLMLCIKHALPLLKPQHGTIVNVASIVGFRPIPLQSPYGASKAAVMNLTKAVAEEAGPDGIRCNTICPGTVDTDLYRGNALLRIAKSGATLAEHTKRLAGTSALGRFTTCEEVASGVLFLASEASGSMTGNAIVMDAGRTLAP